MKQRINPVNLLLTTAISCLADDRPNIILIMADDMGWSDIGCYGGEIETPNLDGLADDGVRFTQFYNTGRCCPTRATLLTGTYAHQAGIGWMMRDQKLPGYRGDLGKNVRTIAEVMKTAGYTTYMSGKWHVTPHVRPGTPTHNWPRQRGFDRFYGTIHGAGSFFDPNSLTRENTLISPLTDKEYQPKEFYYTDAINDHAARYVREHKGEQPFFMYVAHTAPHWPMHALPEDIAKYKGKYDKGWDVMRKARHRRQVKMGLVEKDWEITPRDSKAPKWADAPNKEWDLRNMEVYAAMVDRLDQGVGTIIAALKESKEFDNTLVLFLADNGGCAEGMGRRSGTQYRDKEPDKLKPMAKDALQLDMIPRRTRDGRVVKQGTEVMTGGPDTYHGYGLGWANASNTPFREYKHWVHEGGISSPLIAHWPIGIASERLGKLEKQPTHLIDLMATCVDLAKAKYPSKVGDTQIVPMQGVSLVPALNGKDLRRKKPIFWEHEGNRAIREGKWKLVAKGSNGPWELYDMENDRTELNNLSDSQPARAKAMAERWEDWAVKALAKPWPWGGRKKSQNFNKKKVFRLKQGDDLPQTQAPMVARKGFSFVAKLEIQGDGVIAAQGGTSHGWTLYLKDSRLSFATRRNGTLSVYRTEQPISSTVEVAANLAADGHLTLTVSDKEVLSVKTTGALVSMPIDGLQVGSDKGGYVGDYKSAFPLKGKITEASLKIN